MVANVISLDNFLAMFTSIELCKAATKLFLKGFSSSLFLFKGSYKKQMREVNTSGQDCFRLGWPMRKNNKKTNQRCFLIRFRWEKVIGRWFQGRKKVSDVEILINLLSNVWIGKLRLHAIVARFERKMNGNSSHGVKMVSRNSAHLGDQEVKGGMETERDQEVKGCINTRITLTHDISNDFPLALLGCYKDFRSIANTRFICRSEGFLEVEFKYLGGLWVLFEFKSLDAKEKSLYHKGIAAWFSSLKAWHDDFVVEERLIWIEIEGVPLRAWSDKTFNKICSKWGEMLFIDDSDGCNRLSKRICIKSSHALLVFATSMEDEIQIQENTHKGVHEKAGDSEASRDRYSPKSLRDQQVSESFHKLSNGDSHKQSGFSLIQRLEETMKVGMALGLNMEGCKNTLASLLADNGEYIGNTHFDFASTFARGKSGGIICLWNSLVFQKSNILCNENYVFVDGLWIPNDVHIRWIVVYASQNLSSKIALWSSLAILIANWDGILVVMGDFNEVREAGERFGSIFNKKQAEFFNEFIVNASLVDIPLGGFNFTWTDMWGTKMSKLDWFMISESFYEVFPHTTGVVLEKGILDHRPILLKESNTDYGPTPFRFFHSWLEMDGFHDLVTDTWNNDGIVEIEDPVQVKDEFLVHFSNRFKLSIGMPPSLEVDLINHLFSSQSEFLEQQVSCEEIKRAVWDCRGDRAPGPDGFTFKFFTTFWDLIEDDVSNMMPIQNYGKILDNKLCTVIGSCISPEQWAFIKGINILDDPFILNEVMEWYRKRRKELLIFKVDFEKAFDSLRWDFLDLVMEKLGFGLDA
ncbi:RNA-directed DNA polymerase, eukaryota [Tanacetum coccineum]